jgi:hypothetical protein
LHKQLSNSTGLTPYGNGFVTPTQPAANTDAASLGAVKKAKAVDLFNAVG